MPTWQLSFIILTHNKILFNCNSLCPASVHYKCVRFFFLCHLLYWHKNLYTYKKSRFNIFSRTNDLPCILSKPEISKSRAVAKGAEVQHYESWKKSLLKPTSKWPKQAMCLLPNVMDGIQSSYNQCSIKCRLCKGKISRIPFIPVRRL